MTLPKVVTARAVLQAMLDAGIISVEDRVRRVVIDLELDRAPVMYVERFGDERLLSLVRTLDGIEIHQQKEDKEMGPWPSEEQRGGDHIDWANVTVGEPLPELPADAYPDGSVQLPLFTDDQLFAAPLYGNVKDEPLGANDPEAQ